MGGKMTKYYNMKECFDYCEDSDIPFIEGGRNSSDMWTKKQLLESSTVNFYDALSDKWQIKPKQPKVLSADQAAEKYDSESANPMIRVENAFFRVGYNYGRKYWRLERDQELRRALELARKAKLAYWSCIASGTKETFLSGSKKFESIIHELDDELNNLKPLEGND
jgi:hypothetical protein